MSTEIESFDISADGVHVVLRHESRSIALDFEHTDQTRELVGVSVESDFGSYLCEAEEFHRPGLVFLPQLPSYARVRRLANGDYVAEVWSLCYGWSCLNGRGRPSEYAWPVKTVREALDRLAANGV